VGAGLADRMDTHFGESEGRRESWLSEGLEGEESVAVKHLKAPRFGNDVTTCAEDSTVGCSRWTRSVSSVGLGHALEIARRRRMRKDRSSAKGLAY